MHIEPKMTMTIIFISIGVVFLALLITLFQHLSKKEKDVGKKSRPVKLSRSVKNPILKPRRDKYWESEGAFNPTAVKIKDKVHILYRATGGDGISRIGYASAQNGTDIDFRSDKPIYVPREPFEGAVSVGPGFSEDVWGSGGGWGGCEDPKATILDDKIYMTYVANNGWGPQRVALTSISRDDFEKKRWSNWRKPKLISRPNEINKSAVILPKRIKGKVVVFHRVYPDILVDYMDDLEFAGGRYLETKAKIPIRKNYWDSHKISIGATPIETEHGWLTIYHAVDKKDSGKYKIGAMLLKKDEPHIVLARSDEPLLSPDAPYENDWKPGIAYPSGAVVLGDKLHVYYGGGDKYVCVATAPVKQILDYLLNIGGKPRLAFSA